MTEKKQTITLLEWSKYEAPWSMTLAEFTQTISEAVAKVPPEFVANIEVVASERGYDDETWDLEIRYTRPETDAERQKRERDEAESAARWQRETYQREIAEYARLKAKFEK